ncbi:hypothetical protein N6H18_14610 [Reichenbachiella agarivorans]|uniref:Uncharacterized protein n=1 Tax=Reichenbachiella agarivorans TaxID=2979464 RepID=A0ABY6CM53_9BACT|nr:hypothetical protein [Reichenbachiella agarivorans]UXP31581.1 hypothetical protein N6H18_14610 [Reichenbachiella agarivorans]
MFTEYEIETLIEIEEIAQATTALKKEFLKKEAPYLEISDQDFFSLIMMVPTVGIALANSDISFFEEMSLNRKARKLSKGGYFWGKDPVVFSLKFVIKNYALWEDKFLAVIRTCMERSFDIHAMEGSYDPRATITISQYRKQVLQMPYIFIRFLSSFFLEEDDSIFSTRKMDQVDYKRLLSIGEKLGLTTIPFFHYFCATIEVH